MILHSKFAAGFPECHPAMAPLEVPAKPGKPPPRARRRARTMAKRLDAHLATHESWAADRSRFADITLLCGCGFCRVMKWEPQKEHGHPWPLVLTR